MIDVGLKIKPEVEIESDGKIVWTMRGICDATWGSNKENGRNDERNGEKQ